MKPLILQSITHLFAGVIGFAAGIYLLPILTAPASPTSQQIEQLEKVALFQTTFRRDLEDSDWLHWGEGTVYISNEMITFKGQLAPGPDYKLYLSPVFVETEQAFEENKSRMVRIGDVKTFENFMVSVPSNIDPAAYRAVIVWCEAFGQFITAAKYH